ncbi:hypothetical protein LRS11_06915 [Pseudomonas sp. J452]|uniref:hypothetical protein n=1 Tax=Pseudomonas sp. J452 TaxID=2898441 RepID=UPI0021ADD770|nr:hypothetical protein [Pseudomonas sp. J452]UUY09759.1 hypothetical protein LRS11_06915 [Pseudomonas sp. J452]
MLMMLGLLLCALLALAVLVRGLLLFPWCGARRGWALALRRYGLSVLLCVSVAVWELGALYGFSWRHLGRVNQVELANTAVAYAYPQVYADLGELRHDYARFRPSVSYWDNWRFEERITVWDKLLGDTDYQVRLPDRVVVLDVHGSPQYDYALEDEQVIAPDRADMGLIASVQSRDSYATELQDLQANWSQPQRGEVRLHQRCLSAYSAQPRGLSLTLTAKAHHPLTISPRFGFYRVTLSFSPADDYDYGSQDFQRISRAEFMRLRDCKG